MKVSYERLHELLNYNSETGIFIWKVSKSRNVRAGSVAGSLHTNGYIYITIDGKKYFGHRLAWLYVHGYFPEHGIDHKDQVRHHNWIDNLREVSDVCNLRNAKPTYANNTSGIKGVYKDKATKKWQAQIMINKKQIGLGRFKNKLDAAVARHEAEIKYKWDVCNTKASSAFCYIQDLKEKEEYNVRFTRNTN